MQSAVACIGHASFLLSYNTLLPAETQGRFSDEPKAQLPSFTYRKSKWTLRTSLSLGTISSWKEVFSRTSKSPSQVNSKMVRTSLKDFEYALVKWLQRPSGTSALIRMCVQKSKYLGTLATFFTWLADGDGVLEQKQQADGVELHGYKVAGECQALPVYQLRETYTKFFAIDCPKAKLNE